MLRIVNCVIDELVVALRIEGYAERTRGLCDLVDEHERRFIAGQTDADVRLAALTGMTYQISTHLGHHFARIINTLADVSFVQARDEASRQLIRLAFALEVYHCDHGTYPAGLDALSPEYLREVPLDPFTGDSLRYGLVSPNGYQLYSVGGNLEDDGGRTFYSVPQGDDISIGASPLHPTEDPGQRRE